MDSKTDNTFKNISAPCDIFVLVDRSIRESDGFERYRQKCMNLNQSPDDTPSYCYIRAAFTDKKEASQKQEELAEKYRGESDRFCVIELQVTKLNKWNQNFLRCPDSIDSIIIWGGKRIDCAEYSTSSSSEDSDSEETDEI